jgi:hypothetical protein
MNIIIVDEKGNMILFGIKINCTLEDVKIFCDDQTARGETMRLYKEVN